MESLYRKNQNEFTDRGEDIRKEIRVVPGTFWMILCGSAVIVIAVVLWILTGWTQSTVTVTGVYLPGASDYGEVICFPNVMTGKYIDEGMLCNASLTYYDKSEYGHLKGQVTWTEDTFTSAEELVALVGDKALAESFWKSAPLVCVICALEKDPQSTNGFAWSNPKGGDLELKYGTILQVEIVVSVERPVLGDIL